MSDDTDTKPGVWASLKRILDTLLATAQNRAELFAPNEDATLSES